MRERRKETADDPGEVEAGGEDSPAPSDSGFWREFLTFLGHHPAWWLAPLLLTLILLALAILLLPSEQMPFIYRHP